MSDKKCCDNKKHEDPKEPKFECKKCGRKTTKSKNVCKPKKIE